MYAVEHAFNKTLFRSRELNCYLGISLFFLPRFVAVTTVAVAAAVAVAVSISISVAVAVAVTVSVSISPPRALCKSREPLGPEQWVCAC